MESLPIEILAHIFEQFPKCAICQKYCLRASKWQTLQMCSDTCLRWNKILLEGYSKNVISKCFSEFEDVISVTIDMKNVKSLGLTVLNVYPPSWMSKGIIIYSIQEDGPVALDGKIKGFNIKRIGDSILQVNEINLVGLAFDEALQILKDVVENQKFQSVRLIVGQNIVLAYAMAMSTCTCTNSPNFIKYTQSI